MNHATLRAFRQARRAAYAALIPALLLAAPAARSADTAAPAAAPAGKARLAERFKDWAMICIDSDNKPATPEDCYLNDVPAAQSESGKLMAVVIGYASTKQGEQLLALRFAFAPTTDKDAGFELTIGKEKPLRGTIETCTAKSCETAVMPMSADFVAAMKRADKMVLGIKLKDKGPLSVPVSLSGITAALNALAKGAPPAAAAAPAPAQAAPGAPKMRVAQESGDWAIVCADSDSNAATPEQCILNHSVDGGQTLAVNILYAQPAPDKPKELVLEFVFPPTTQQDAGFQASIDGTSVLKGPILKCEKEACLTLLPFTPDLSAAMKKGTKMAVGFTVKGKGVVSAAASLRGFTAAVDAFRKMNGLPAVAQDGQGQAAGGPKSTAFQDWSLICGNAAGGGTKCIISQTVPPQQEKKLLLVAQVGYGAAGGGAPSALLLLLFPPAADKDSGFQVVVDDKPVAKSTIKSCDTRLCQAEMALQPGLIDLMRQGTRMSVVYKVKDKGDVSAPVSLKGFSAAIEALQAKS